MRAISLFSGAGGFELGLERAGVQTVLQAECDPWCLQVLERHWPDCERVDDVRDVRGDGCRLVDAGRDSEHPSAARWHGEPVDLVYGGFPCQDVSVAGARAGFSGQRSSLWFEFERVLRELRPRWALIENVPGLLSSGPTPGADFGVVLRGLVELGYGVAWRTLDARWFGVPQRRRRVFLVSCVGDPQRAAQVLAVCESCGGHPATSREAREGLTRTTDAGTDNSGVIGAPDGGGFRALTARESGYRMDFETENFVVAQDLRNGSEGQTSMSLQGGGQGQARGRSINSIPHVVASTFNGGDVGEQAPSLVSGDGPHGRSPGYNGMDLVVASAVRASDGHHGWSGGRGDGADNLVLADPISAHEGKTYTHEGKNNFRMHNVIGFGSKDFGQDAAEDVAPTVRVGPGSRSGGGPQPPAIAFDWQSGEEGDTSFRGGSRAYRVRAGDYAAGMSGSHHDAVAGDFGVRRLTPLECERLMGWPDQHTRWTADGKEISDSHRYRLCGNGVVAPVAEWLGHRLVAVDGWSP